MGKNNTVLLFVETNQNFKNGQTNILTVLWYSVPLNRLKISCLGCIYLLQQHSLVILISVLLVYHRVRTLSSEWQHESIWCRSTLFIWGARGMFVHLTRVGKHVVFVRIHCTDVRIHCRDM